MLRGDRLEQAQIGLAEGVVALVVLERDRAEDAIAGEHRHDEQAARAVGACPDGDAAFELLLDAADQHRPVVLAVEAVLRGARRERAHVRRQSRAVLAGIEVAHRGGSVVPPADAHVFGGEHLAQLVADDVDDRLEVELGAHACWMALITASSALRCAS